MPAKMESLIEDLAARVVALESIPRCTCNGCRDAERARELDARRAQADDVIARAADHGDLLAALHAADDRLRREILQSLPRPRAIAFGVSLSDDDFAALRSAFEVYAAGEIDLRRAPREHHVVLTSSDPRLDWARGPVVIPPADWIGGGLRHELAGVATSIDADQRGVYQPPCFAPSQPRRVIAHRAYLAMVRFDRELADAIRDGTLTMRECTPDEDLNIARTNARTQGVLR